MLAGMDLSLWPRVRKLFVDWGTGASRRRLLPWVWSWKRTFAWLGRNRRLAKDYEENPRVSEAWVYLGMLRLLVKRLARAA